MVSLGIPPIDDVLGGGLVCGALHEIAAARETETAAATGFALALAIRRQCAITVLWIAEELSLAENGVPYGPGLDQAGFAPERLITVSTARGRDVLWAMEEALRCPAIGAVIGEMPRARHRSGGDAAALARGRGRQHARLSGAHRAGRCALRRRDALDHRRGALLGKPGRKMGRRSAALGGAARAQPSRSSRSLDRGVEQCGAAFRARNEF